MRIIAHGFYISVNSFGYRLAACRNLIVREAESSLMVSPMQTRRTNDWSKAFSVLRLLCAETFVKP